MTLTSNRVKGSVGSSTITDDSIVNADINSAAAIAATKIANGSVSNAEFQYLDGVTSAIQTQLAAKQPIVVDNGWFKNLAIVRATGAVAGDTIKITSANGTALSASNYGTVTLPSTVTAGQSVTFTITADVSLLLTGIHGGAGTLGDITGAILRVLAINDNATLKWGVGRAGGRKTLLTTDTSATQTSVDAFEKVFCTSAVASASNTCRELGYCYANFDDAGGSSEDLWIIQSNIYSIVTGSIADGLWQPWNPAPTGFVTAPTPGVARWSQTGRDINVEYYSGDGTSNATTLTFSLPTKEKNGQILFLGGGKDNGAVQTAPMRMDLAAGSRTATIYKDLNGTAFTASGTKMIVFNSTYEVGPSASFL